MRRTAAPRRAARRILAGMAALAVAALAAGCTTAAEPQTSQSVTATVSELPPLTSLTPVEHPRELTGEVEAKLGTNVITPVADNPTQTFPAQVTSKDLSGDTQQTVAKADRVIGMDLSGSIAATLVGLGFQDKLVGRDVSTVLPGTEDLPVVTQSGHSVNLESIVALQPDLVITDGSIGPTDVVEQLRDSGITLVYVDNDLKLDGPASLARQVATAMGAPEAGEQLADQLDAGIAEKIDEIKQIIPKDESDRVRMAFLYIRGNSGIYYLFGEGSGADTLIDAIGGIDVADEIGWAGMKPLTAEAMVKADPDLLLVMKDGLESAGGVDGLLETRPEIAMTTAGKNRRFVSMADGDILSFGPRTPEVLDALARAIYFEQS